MRKILFLTILLFFNLSNFGQTKDSLLNVLKTEQADSSKISTLFELASELYLSNPDTTIKICEEILKIAIKTNDKKNIAESLGWLGYLYDNIGQSNKALKYDLQAADILKRNGDQSSLATTYINIASIYDDKGNILKALEYYSKSLNIQKAIGDAKGMAITQNNLGYIYYNLGDIKKAIAYWLKSLKIQQQIGDKKGIATIYINLGAVYSSQENPQKAKQYYLNSLEIYKEIKDVAGQAISYKNIGSLYFDQKKYTLSLNYYIKSILLYRKIKNISGVAELYLDMANIAEIRNSLDSAKLFTQKSLNLYKQKEDPNGIASAYLILSDISLKKKKYYQALKYSLKAHEIYEKLGFPELIQASAKSLKVIYKKLGNYKKSCQYFDLEIAMRDSILNKKNYKSLIQQQSKYKYDKQVAIDSMEMQKIISENIVRKKNLHITLIFLVIFAILLLLSMYFYYQKVKTNKILAEKKDLIDKKKQELNQQNEEIKTINEKLFEKQQKLEIAHKEITDSIEYAKKIQTAAFPKTKFFTDNFSDFFIFYKPLKIISGDFYWAKKLKNFLIFAVADSSGHGVPGAFISMLGISVLNEILFLQNINTSGEILDNVRLRIKEALNQLQLSRNEDGLDISLCILNKTNLELQFSGAYNSLYIVSNKSNNIKLEILKADRQPVGVFVKEHPFTNKTIKLTKGDNLYLFSDGFMDQFDETITHKFGRNRFRNLIIEIFDKPMDSQKKIITDTFYQWKGNSKQIDDILVLGLKI